MATPAVMITSDNSAKRSSCVAHTPFRLFQPSLNYQQC
jgi:hypothetical protein